MPDEPKVTPPPEPETKFTQQQVDSMIQTRLARETDKYPGYEDLVKFKTDHEKNVEAQTQKDLESQNKYDEAQKANLDKITNLEKIILDNKTVNQNLKVDHSLINEINAQNGYAESALPVLKTLVKVNESGEVQISGTDSNKQNTLLGVAEGVKQFLENRPYLVKANQVGGAGTASSMDGGAGAAAAGDLSTLTLELQQARSAGDHKRVAELTPKIQALLNKKGQNVLAF